MLKYSNRDVEKDPIRLFSRICQPCRAVIRYPSIYYLLKDWDWLLDVRQRKMELFSEISMIYPTALAVFALSL